VNTRFAGTREPVAGTIEGDAAAEPAADGGGVAGVAETVFLGAGPQPATATARQMLDARPTRTIRPIIAGY
jgi:hypothetical protein